MKLTTLLISLACIFLTGCNERTPQEIANFRAVNTANLMNGQETVGTLPDGRVVTRTWVYSPNGYYHHFIYIVDGATTVSTNRLEQEGKVQVNKTDVVIINGVEYTKKK